MSRAIGKNMPQMGITTIAGRLYPDHPMPGIFIISDIFNFKWVRARRPAGCTPEFSRRVEQWCLAASALVYPRFKQIAALRAVSPFGTFVSCNQVYLTA